jgi:hypothetical protein
MKNHVMPFSEALRLRFLPKLIVGLLALAILALVGGLIAGLTGGELRGQLAFGLLAACALVTLAVSLSMRIPEAVFRVVRWSWLTLAMLVLVVAIAFSIRGGDIVLTYSMVALAFPASVLITPLAGSLLGSATQHISGLCLLWLILFCTGYFQWFILCSRLFRNAGPRRR